MTELEGLRAEPLPRDEAICRKLARRIEPGIGFIVYGVLWVCFVTNTLVLGGILGGALAGDALGSRPLAFGLATVLALALGGGSLWLYIRWCRGKRARARMLVRDGEIIDGKVEDRLTDRAAQAAAKLAFAATGQRLGVTWYRVAFTHGITRYHVMAPFAHKPEPGAVASVLFLPQHKYALAFDPDGRAVVSRVSS